MLRREQISPVVWAIYGEKEPDVAKAFIRFQEYYENTDLKGKRGVIVRDIEQWQKVKSNDGEAYYTAWMGFNIPGRIILDLVRSGDFRPGFSIKNILKYPRWHEEETEFLKLIEDLSVEQINNGYFIGMWRESVNVLEHEIAHAFFATVPSYKAEQMSNIGELPKDLYDSISKHLLDMGYHKDVVYDEIQAYLSTYVDTLNETFKTDKYNDYAESFVKTFERYRNQTSPA